MMRFLMSPHRRRSAASIVAAVVSILLAACSVSKDFDLANAAIAHFRELMTAQKFDQIYSESADDLKKSTPEPNLTRLLGAIDRKLGAFKSAQSNGWNLNYNASGTMVTLTLKSQFEKGTGVETFVYRISGGKALLASYRINSDDLIIN